jgi:hypothetical protein
MIVLNHIYPDESRRELVRSNNLDELRKYASERLDDDNLVSLFTELEEWKAEGRKLAPMTERLTSSLEIVILKN